MWLKTYFKELPAAAARELLNVAASHQQDSPEDPPGRSRPPPRQAGDGAGLERSDAEAARPSPSATVA